MRRTLIVMVKEPRPGRVKTRLGRDIGLVPAAWWFRHQVRALLRRVEDPQWQIVLAVSPDVAGLKSRFWPAHLPRLPQGSGDLGVRMARMLRSVGNGAACVIGADIPDVDKRRIAEAFAALGDHDAVFGPAPDGGYWLIGLKHPGRQPPGFFGGVRWSTKHALADSKATLPDHRIAEVATLRDVDRADDLPMTRPGVACYLRYMSKIPTKAEILEWIEQNPTLTAKRDIAKAFGIKGAARIDLKRVLKELEEEGHLEKRKRSYQDPDRLPPVSVLLVTGPDRQGDLFAKPMEWHGEGKQPVVLVLPRASDPALGEGDRILARLTLVKNEDHHYEARLIRRIGTNPKKVLGIFRKKSEGGRIVPIDKGMDREWVVAEGATHGAKDGELVEAEQAGPKGRIGLPKARIVERLGDPSAPKAVSLIAIHQHGIPDQFPDDVIAEADAQKPMGLKGREDLRDLPLITIDPSDARDHDDACYAHADEDPKNEGGHILWVAIADVAAYVTPGSALDREARKRGNSTYFPDRVVPMLPDRLSGDLCSLHEGVPRACIAVRMVLDSKGNKLSHTFHRGLMRSPASLHYEEVQDAVDGNPNDRCGPLLEPVLKPLYAAYAALKKARNARQPLDLDLPERRVVLDEDGTVKSVNFKDRLDAHRLIEEFMVLANVASAETLLSKKVPLLFRIHEEPTQEKLKSLRETAEAAGFTLAKGQVLKTAHLNKLLNDAAGTDEAELINLSTLRSMTQAYYGPQHIGHFGLALRSYAHFTSPIRRYSDLIVHRALITAHGWGKDGLRPEDYDTLEQTGAHISDTERRSMMAERDTTDRYLASYLSERVGNEFQGRVSGIARFGVFVKLDETGADGLLPMRSIGNEYFHYDAESQTLMGADTGMEISLGQRVTVRLAEAVPVTGGIALELLEIEGNKVPQGRQSPAGRAPRRKSAKAKRKKDKIKRKVSRTRR